MLDLNRTLQLVRGALFDPEATWRGYLPEAGDWKHTAVLLTVPLIVASTVIAYLLGLMASDTSLFGQFRPTLVSSLLNIITGAITAGVVAYIFSALAGVFGGRNSFAFGLAATSLAFVPGYVGQALTWLPWIGGLLALGLGIYGLVLLWKIIPLYLEVPDGKRAGHYIVSLLASIVVIFILASVVGRLLYDTLPGSPLGDLNTVGSTDGEPSGAFGSMTRQAELIAAAEEDTYTPPSDGRISDAQARAFIRVVGRSAELQAEKEERLKEIAEKADTDEQVSLRDFNQVLGSLGDFAGLQTTEMEVVKTGGGNWAEHQWVRNALRAAWIQKDGSEAIEHNYRLYEKYEDELSGHIAR